MPCPHYRHRPSRASVFTVDADIAEFKSDKGIDFQGAVLDTGAQRSVIGLQQAEALYLAWIIAR
jgi:hypothetical protein